MTATESIDVKHQEDLARLRGFRLLDDDFFTQCFEGDLDSTQLVLRIVLEQPDLTVTDARAQVFVSNLLKRSVRLDVLATDAAGKKYNIEIQRSDKGAGRRRARYHSSILDARLLEKGQDFDALPETYVVFLTEHDVMGAGLPLYHVEKHVEELGERFGDGAHILYVNGAYRDETPIGRLMHDFACTNPAEMHYEVLAERTKFFKESKEGVAIMCKVIEDMREQSRQEGIQEGIQKSAKKSALRMLAAGKLSIAEIAEYAGLPLGEVKKLQAGNA